MSRRIRVEFESEILKRCANRSDITTTQYVKFLHDAYLWCCASYIHPEIEGTTTATQAIAADVLVPVATDIWYIEMVKNTGSGFRLDPGDRDEIEDMVKRDGTARKWYWWNQTIVVDNLATAIINYKLWYIKKVAEIEVGDSPVIDELFDPIIIMKAAEIGLSTVRDYKEAAFQTSQINAYTMEMNLPKKMNRRNDNRAGVRPRHR
jgi:hypothetical protein